MNGKKKCNTLKNVRRHIARANNIKLEIPECTHTGDCPGTCPRCESEVRYLERALAERRKRGLKVAVAGVSAGLVALNAASCEPLDRIADLIGGGQTAGDIMVEENYLDGNIMPPEGEIALDGDIAFFPEAEVEPTASDTADVAGLLQEGCETFDETVPMEDYALAGVMPYTPSDDECVPPEETE